MTTKNKSTEADAISPSTTTAVVVQETEDNYQIEDKYVGWRKATIGLPEQVNKDYTDPVVMSLAGEHRPQPALVCQHCPGACFFTTHNQLKCFCKHMNMLSWQTSSPIPITSCTAQGIFVAQWKAQQVKEVS